MILTELFLNNRYKGVYMLMEQVDRKLLKLKKNQKDIRGELFKGCYWAQAVLCQNAPPYNNEECSWSGFEYKYPKDTINWENLYRFVDFVAHSSKNDFKENIWNQLEENNFIDYFIFTNCLAARDNFGKNIYYARYDRDEPLFMIPWDLDGCFGTNWQGKENEVYDYFFQGPSSLFYKIDHNKPQDYESRFIKRYEELRNGLLSYASITTHFDSIYQQFQDQCLYEREALAWKNYEFKEEKLDYIKGWVRLHLEFLDSYLEVTIVNASTVTMQEAFALQYNAQSKKIRVVGEDSNHHSYVLYALNGTLAAKGFLQNNEVSLHGLKTGIYIFQYKKKRLKILIK